MDTESNLIFRFVNVFSGVNWKFTIIRVWLKYCDPTNFAYRQRVYGIFFYTPNIQKGLILRDTGSVRLSFPCNLFWFTWSVSFVHCSLLVKVKIKRWVYLSVTPYSLLGPKPGQRRRVQGTVILFFFFVDLMKNRMKGVNIYHSTWDF